jgi:histidine ammonia-lyase
MNHLVAIDLLTGAFWTDVRKAQDKTRSFGAAPTAALAALRKVAPLNAAVPGNKSIVQITYDFMKSNPASAFYHDVVPMPPGEATLAAPSTTYLGPQH